MARLTAIRTALAGVLTGVTGIIQTQDYPPSSIAANGTAWIGFFDTAVTFSQREIHLHSVPVTVCVNLNQRHEAGLKATEPLIDAVLAALRANQGLGLADVMRTEVTRVEQGVWEVGGTPFIGFQVTLAIKESFAATYGG